MLSQDAKNLANSISDLHNRLTQIASIMGALAVNMQCLAESLQNIEAHKIVHQPSERPANEDYQNIA